MTLLNKSSKTSFKCTQTELYAACRIGWRNFETHLQVFNAHKPKYDAAYATAALAAIDAAEAMPAHASRTEVSRTLRLQMKQTATECCETWQLLKSYINTAYDEAFRKPKLDAAGAGYYPMASRFDWEEVLALMIAGKEFLAKESAALQAGNNMPAAFPTNYQAVLTRFSDLLNAFNSAGQEAELQTMEKWKANEALYNHLLSMLKDARVYFKNEKAIQQQFVWENILSRVSRAVTAGLSGEVLDATTAKPLGAVVLSLTPEGELTPRYTATSGADGTYDFGNIASGTYILQLTAQDKDPAPQTVVIQPGVHSRKTITL